MKKKINKSEHGFLGYLWRILRWTMISVSVAIMLIIVVYWQTDWLERAAAGYLNDMLGEQGRVAYSKIEGGIFNRISVHDLDINFKDSFSLQSGKVEIKYDFWPLLFKKINISAITVDQVELKLYSVKDTLEVRASGAGFNIDSLISFLKKETPFKPVFEKIPLLNINDIILQVGRLHVDSKPITLQDVRFHLRKFSIDSNRAAINCEHFSGIWKERDVRVSDLSFSASAGMNSLNLTNLSIKTEGSFVHLGANINTGHRNSVNLEVFESNILLDELIAADILSPEHSGQASAKISVSGNWQELSIHGDARGRWQNHIFKYLKVSGGYDGRNFFIKNLQTKVDKSSLDFNGRWRPKHSLQGKLEVENVDFSDWSSTKIPVILSGMIEADIQPLQWERLAGKASLFLHNAQFYDIPLDSLRLEMSAQDGIMNILPSTNIRMSDSVKIAFDGQLSHDWQTDLIVTTFDMNLGELADIFKMEPMSGMLDAHFRMYGPINDPDVSGLFSMPFFVKDSIALDSIRFELFTMNTMTKRKGTADFVIGSAKVYSFPMRNILFKAEFENDTIKIPEISMKSEDNTLYADMVIIRNPDDIEINFNEMRLDYEKYWLSNDGLLSFIIDSSYISLETFKLRGPDSSSLEIQGFIDRETDDAQVYMTIRDVELEQFNQFWDYQPLLSGNVDGIAELIDPFHDPNLDIDLKLNDFNYNGIDIGKIDGKFKYANSSIYINEFEYDDQSSHLSFSGDLALDFSDENKDFYNQIKETQLNLEMKWEQISLNKISRALALKKPLNGLVSGYFYLGGRANRPVIRHHLQAVDFRYGKYKIDNLSGFAQYNSGYLSLDSLGVELDGTTMQMNGWMQYALSFDEPDTNFFDNPFEAYFYAKDDTLTLLSLFNEQLEMITGDIESELYMTGTLGKPAIEEGFIRIQNGEALLSRIKDPIREANINMVIEDSTLTFEQFRGYSKKKQGVLEKFGHFIELIIPGSGATLSDGLLEIDGTIKLNNITRPMMDVNVVMRNFYIDYFIENTKVKLQTDNLRIFGRDTITISGTITMPEGRYQVDLKQMEKNVYLTSKQVQRSPPYIAMSLDLQLPGHFIVSSSPLDLTNNFKINLSGDLQVQQEAGFDLVQIFGLVEVPSGEYSAWNQNFNIQSGSIHFKDPTRMNPELNITATKRMGNRVFELTISGELEKWRQDIRVMENGRELPLSPADKITMLTLGADVGQMQTNADSTFRNIGEEVLTTAFLTALERSAEKYTGLDKIKIDTEESFFDLQKGRLNNGLEDASISFGKYLTHDLYLEYQTRFGGKVPTPQLSWEAGNRLGLKYRINKFWAFDSQYEKTIQGNNKMQIGISWEYSF